MVTEDQVWETLRGVSDPEFPLNIVDLGMVYGVSVADSCVHIRVTFTSIGCPAMEMILSDIRDAVKELPSVSEVSLEVVWSPPWTKERISAVGRQVLQTYGVGV